jgi:cytidine deaminase
LRCSSYYEEEEVSREELMNAARAAAGRAYAPYSRFRVGAAVLTESGALHTGCNVENASYGLTICAERNAVASMVAGSPEDRRIKSVAVTSLDGPSSPCGACRQVLREFGCGEVFLEEDGDIRRYPLEELLPKAFGPESL